jgi:NADH:ubiquinone oxidoreductase subunit K
MYTLFYFLFVTGVLSLLIHAQDITRYLLSLELLLISISFYVVMISIISHDTKGALYVLAILSISSCEVVVGLSLLIKVSQRIRLVI